MTRDIREPLHGGITRVTLAATNTVVYESRWSWTDAGGRRQFGRQRHRTLKAAQQHRARMVAALADGRDVSPSRLTVDAYAEIWLARRARDWSTSTTYTRRHQYVRHVKPRIGGLRLVQVSRARLQEMADELAGTWAPGNVRSIMALVSGLFRGAMQDGHIASNPAERLDLPAARHQEHVTWTDAEVRRFLNHTRDHPHWPVYVLLLATGMRIGEALALRWPNVDLEAGTVRIADTLRRTASGAIAPAAGAKTGKSRRTVPIPPGVVAILRERSQPDGYVFRGPDGQCLDYSEVARQLRSVQERMGDGWPMLTLHGMRHTVGTMLMRAGVHPVNVKELLGHSQITVTLDQYSHPALADLRGAVAVTGAVVDGTIAEEESPE